MTTSLSHHAVKRVAVALTLAALALVLLLALAPDAALAVPLESDLPPGQSATDATQAGQNLGDLIRSLAGPVVFSIAGFTGVAAVFKRDLGSAFTLVVITALIGLFVTTPGGNALHGLTDTLANAIGAR